MKENLNFNDVYKFPLRADKYVPSVVWTADGHGAFDFVTGTKNDIEWDDLITVRKANKYLNVINGKKKSHFTQKFVYEDSYIYYTEDDGKLYPVISIRGWGYLTNPNRLNLSSDDAAKIADSSKYQCKGFSANVYITSDITAESNDISDADTKQVAIYAMKEGITTAYLLYPQIRYEELDAKPIKLHSEYQHDNKTIKIIAMRIPFVFDEDKNVTLTNLKRAIDVIFE